MGRDNSSLFMDSFDIQENSTFLNNSIENVGNWSNHTTSTTKLTYTTTAISTLKEFDFLNPVWNIAFSAIVITGTLGNLIVLWIVLGESIEFL